ncbi:MAG: esterase-like activity of phytase family protein [Jaaginema sp. PMC 1080.18]|nr:esterase-like activity of phytase family protein [Jaaginema sp. PMC 1080.18]MEC4867253.1 esterase-like activity of phytase family protein [Jaaginema sp. PMC 1078.18]
MSDVVLKSWRTLLRSLVVGLLLLGLTACSRPTQVLAQDRIFLDLSLEFLDAYELPKSTFADTPVGGLSALTYDRHTGQFYALSDDRAQNAPARFYTLEIPIQSDGFGKIEIQGVTFLKDENGEQFAPGSLDPEGLALSPRNTLFLSSEGVPSRGINPFIAELDLKTGQKLKDVRIPQRYLLNTPTEQENTPRGVQENLGFEALTLGIVSVAPQDPFRLFVAPEGALIQEKDTPERLRLLHYLINPIGPPVLLSENLYLLDTPPEGTIINGLTELVALDREGFLLSLERTFGLEGAGAKLFQVATGEATDTLQYPLLNGEIKDVKPLRKKQLLDLRDLGFTLDNLEGMTLGPKLPDGSSTLLLMSDDNFSDNQVTQLLLFRLFEK